MNNILCISDLHLDSVDSPLTEALFNLLLEHKNVPTDLYLLGDLFEIWIGDDHETDLANAVAEHLSDFAKDHNNIFFIHGNRDFLVGDAFAKRGNFKLCCDPTYITFGDMKIALSHGDFLCTSDVDYINFRNSVRTSKWQVNFLQKSLSERKTIASEMRQQSKVSSFQKDSVITDVNVDAVLDFLSMERPDIFVHGHTHRPKIHQHKLNDQTCDRYVLGDWGDTGWYFKIDKNGPELIQFNISS